MEWREEHEPQTLKRGGQMWWLTERGKGGQRASYGDDGLRNGEQEGTVGGKMAVRVLAYVWTRLQFPCEYETENTGLTGAQCWGPGWGCGVGGVGVDTEVVDVEVWMRRGRTEPRTLLQESEDERERRNWILSMSRSFKSCVEREGGKEGRTEVEMYGPGLGVVRELVWILPSLCSCFGRFMSFTFKWKSIWLIHCCFISSSC